MLTRLRRPAGAAAAVLCTFSFRTECASQSTPSESRFEERENAEAHQFLHFKKEKKKARDAWIDTNRQGMLQIAHVVNATLDIPFFDEEEECTIFGDVVSDCVRCVLQVLPKPYTDLMGSFKNDKGIDHATAFDLKRRLLVHTRKQIHLPFLHELDESAVTRCIVELLVESMRRGRSFDSVCDIQFSGRLFVDVFVMGSADLLAEAGQEDAIETLVNVIGEMVPLPIQVKRHMAVTISQWLSGHLEVAILSCYNERLEQVREAAVLAREHILNDPAQLYTRSSLLSLYRAQLQHTQERAVKAANTTDADSEAGIVDPFSDQVSGQVRKFMIQSVNNEIDFPILNEDDEEVIISYFIDAVIMPSIDKERMDNAMQAIMAQHMESIVQHGEKVLKLNSWKPEKNTREDRVSTAKLLKDLVVVPAAVLTGAATALFLLMRARNSASAAKIITKAKQLKDKVKKDYVQE